MPFKSFAQVRKFASLVKQGKMSKETFKKWLHHTPHMSSLPERVKSDENKTKTRQKSSRKTKTSKK